MLVPVMAAAQTAEQCVLQDKTVSRNQVIIDERTPIRRDVVPYLGNQRKCIVDFRVRIGTQWHTAFGEYVWPGDRPDHEACAVAVSRAEDAVRERVGKNQTVSEKILICKDRDELRTLASPGIGVSGDIGQFRPHPEYRGDFWHNGTRCRWFVDSAFTGQDVRTFQGIVCKINARQWVVVDKF